MALAQEFSDEPSLNEAAQREVRQRLNHVMAGFDKEQREVKTASGSSPNLGMIWDWSGTVQKRRQFAKLLFSRVPSTGTFGCADAPLITLFSSFSNSPSPVQNLF